MRISIPIQNGLNLRRRRSYQTMIFSERKGTNKTLLGTFEEDFGADRTIFTLLQILEANVFSGS